MTRIRKPTDQLAGCCWLPRFIDKVRLQISGKLPLLYRMTFCSPMGFDGYFLRHFQIRKNDFLKAVQDSGVGEDGIGQWFLAQPGVTEERVAEWNAFAPRLGESGQPGYWTFHLVKYVFYPKAVAIADSSHLRELRVCTARSSWSFPVLSTCGFAIALSIISLKRSFKMKNDLQGFLRRLCGECFPDGI
ncbi:DUF5069 domain-containing protein [Nitrospira sp. M1]